MTATKRVETAMFTVERFTVVLTHPDGRDVRSDRQRIPSYPFKRAAPAAMTVARWIQTRFDPHYANFKCRILDGHGQKVPGNTQLKTVRSSYTAT